PVRAIVCGLSEALSLIVTDAARLPFRVGVKVTSILQLAPTASVPPVSGQVLVPARAKSPLAVPVMVMGLTLKVALPEFVKLAVCGALLPPTSWLPKLKAVGDSAANGARPVPVNTSLCGLPGASSEIVTAPVRAPAARGEKAMPRAQLCPPSTVPPALQSV